MKIKNCFPYGILLLVVALLLTACGGAAQPTEATPEPEEAEPTELDIAVIHEMTVEEAWSKVLMEELDDIIAAKPHGLTISADFTENVSISDAEHVFREYAETGKYEIIWAHSGYSDQVKNVKDDYPDILWILAGPGNEGLGGNAYWVYVHMHEHGYLLGTLAGLLTETNIISAVAAFPFPDPNDVLNGYIDGAKAVNSEVKAKITFIDSWYDPPKAKEAAYAQIAAGSDVIFVERYGPFEACEEHGLYCFGHYIDYHERHPDVYVTGSILAWTPLIEYAIDVWWDHIVEGKPYEGSMEPFWLPMTEGGVAPLYEWEEKLPQDVVEIYNETLEAILNGTLEVPLNEEPPVSD